MRAIEIVKKKKDYETSPEKDNVKFQITSLENV